MEHAGHVVTPQGVRAGEPGALAALCERRGAAVLAYAREVCAPDEAPLAAAEALARFRAAVWAAGDASDLDPERLLLSATRHAAADRARTTPETSTTRRILGRGQTLTCERMPALIVARTENLLGSADLDRLSRHLERCQSCRATEAAFRRAERAYIATAHAPLDANTTALLLAALAEAAPVEAEAPPLPAEPEARAPEPAPEATEPGPTEPGPTEPEPTEPEPTEPEPTEPAEPEAVEPEPDTVLLPAEPLYPAPALPPTEPLPTEHLLDELDDADEDGWAEDHRDPHMLEPGPATWNATEEPPRRRRLRIVLPVIVLAAGAAAAMAVAGVFDSGSSGGGSPATTRPATAAPAHTSTATHAHHKRKKTKTTTTVTATP